MTVFMIPQKMLVHESNSFVQRNDLSASYGIYTESERGNGDIFTCVGFSIDTIWWNKLIFLFDSQSWNTDGYYAIGKAVLSELCLVSSLNSYIRFFYEKRTSISLETCIICSILV